MTEEKDKELIPPDYYGHPEDDDPLEEIIEESDEDARIEKILNDEAADKQAQEQKRKEEPVRMADAPFTPTFGQSTFGGGVNSLAGTTGPALTLARFFTNNDNADSLLLKIRSATSFCINNTTRSGILRAVNTLSIIGEVI